MNNPHISTSHFAMWWSFCYFPSQFTGPLGCQVPHLQHGATQIAIADEDIPYFYGKIREYLSKKAGRNVWFQTFSRFFSTLLWILKDSVLGRVFSGWNQQDGVDKCCVVDYDSLHNHWFIPLQQPHWMSYSHHQKCPVTRSVKLCWVAL